MSRHLGLGSYGDVITEQNAALALQQAMAKLSLLTPAQALAAIAKGALAVPPVATVESTQSPNFWQQINSPNPTVSGPAQKAVISAEVAAMTIISAPVGAFMAVGVGLESLFSKSGKPRCSPSKVFVPSDFWPYQAPSGFAGAEVIPMLADQAKYANLCWSAYYNGSVGYNTYAAVLAFAWNAHALGAMVDYFVPLLNDPTKGYFQAGYTVSAPSGVRTTYSGLANGAGGSPFLYPIQAPYAFWPLSAVPSDIIAPGSSITGASLSSYEYTGGLYSASGGVAPTWSRLRAKAGPLPGIGHTIAKVAVGAGIAAAVAPALLRWATGKSAEVLLEQALAAIADL